MEVCNLHFRLTPNVWVVLTFSDTKKKSPTLNVWHASIKTYIGYINIPKSPQWVWVTGGIDSINTFYIEPNATHSKISTLILKMTNHNEIDIIWKSVSYKALYLQ